MCIVSNAADYWQHDFGKRWPQIPVPLPDPEPVEISKWLQPLDLSKYATKEDLEKLRKEIEELKALLVQAQKYDEATGQPNCDSPDKFKLLKWLAEALKVDLSGLKLNE